jgi:hypothetical protein
MLALVAVAGLVLFGAGFGVGRVKNAAKLAAIGTEVKAVEGKVTADFSAVVAKIRQLL